MTLIERYYKTRVRPDLFARSKQDPEIAHEWAIQKMLILERSVFFTALVRLACVYNHLMLETRVMGLDFPNPLGLAAGFDKHCQIYSRAIPAFGWGFCDVGGITYYPQTGSDRPRMWLSEEFQSFCNFMGFNNLGAHAASILMAKTPRSVLPVGLNVGKSKLVSMEDAANDYCLTINLLYPYVDFITVNPSSPNTPGLRELQKRAKLLELLLAVKKQIKSSASGWKTNVKPFGVKLAPDLSDEALAECIDVCKEVGVNFIEIANTTTSAYRRAEAGFPLDRGGVSGQLLKEKAERMLTQVYQALRVYQPKIYLIGVGGIRDAVDLYKRIRLGADLCRVYTAWPYEGPDFAKRTLKDLVTMLKVDGFANVSEAVGCEV